MNVITMDCRGLEFVEFKPDVRLLLLETLRWLQCSIDTDYVQGEWKASGAESGTKFSGIDLTDGEWFDYDEKSSEEVSVTNIKWEIRRA